MSSRLSPFNKSKEDKKNRKRKNIIIAASVLAATLGLGTAGYYLNKKPKEIVKPKEQPKEIVKRRWSLPSNWVKKTQQPIPQPQPLPMTTLQQIHDTFNKITFYEQLLKPFVSNNNNELYIQNLSKIKNMKIDSNNVTYIHTELNNISKYLGELLAYKSSHLQSSTPIEPKKKYKKQIKLKK